MLPTFEGDSLAERRLLTPTPQGGSREQLQSVIGIGGAARAMANTAIRSLEGYGVSVAIFVFRFCAPFSPNEVSAFSRRVSRAGRFRG